MTTVFVGGSRHVSRLPAAIKDRLVTMIDKGHQVIVGDANGADKAMQKHLANLGYRDVTVFCSGPAPRNNLGGWTVRSVTPDQATKGFAFFAAKDRQMAREADFGLMVWDGKSPGTVLNVLRLVQAGKIAVLANVPENATLNIKAPEQWQAFFTQCSPSLRDDLQGRATVEEWAFAAPASQLGLPLDQQTDGAAATMDASRVAEHSFAEAINAALASGDPATFVDALGGIARAKGMSQVAKDAGLSRESLYRSLGSGGNPEFATVLKVISSLGLRLQAGPRVGSPPDHHSGL